MHEPRRRDVLLWGALFVGSRAATIALCAHRVSWDVYYYWFSVTHSAQSLGEYPVPNLWMLRVLTALAPGEATFAAFFVGVLLTVDATAAIVAWRARPAAGAVWVVLGAAMGAITWFRLDLLGTAAVVLACLWAVSRPGVAGALLGFGAALKLWPVLLIGAFAAAGRAGARRFVGFAVVGGGLGVVSLVVAGWTRSAAPLSWQAERGLQIESIAATPFMLGRLFAPGTWMLQLTNHNAWEVSGPGVTSALTATSIATVAAVATAASATFRLRGSRSEGLLWTAVALIGLLLVANKTFSTQYIWWLAGPVVALVALQARGTMALAASLVTVSFATQIIYPWTYGALIEGSVPATLVLVARNLAVVTLAGVAAVVAWRTTAPDFRVTSVPQA